MGAQDAEHEVRRLVETRDKGGDEGRDEGEGKDNERANESEADVTGRRGVDAEGMRRAAREGRQV